MLDFTEAVIFQLSPQIDAVVSSGRLTLVTPPDHHLHPQPSAPPGHQGDPVAASKATVTRRSLLAGRAT
jgi:hypothetical protein